MSTEMKGNVNDSLWFFPAKPEQREVLFQVFVACVASVSNRVTARKLEQEQKRPFFFFLLSSQLSRRTREETLATQAKVFVAISSQLWSMTSYF